MKGKLLQASRMPSRGQKIFAIFLAFILLGITIYFSAIKSRYQKDLKEINARYQDLKSIELEIKSVKSRRGDFFRIQTFLGFPTRFSFSASAFIRKLSFVDLKNIHLLEMNIFPHQQDITFFLRGLALGAEGNAPKKILDAFCLQLKDIGGIFEISCLPEKGKTDEFSSLNFTVNGKLEVE